MIPQDLLNILACPICKGDLLYDSKRDILLCQECKVYYPVEEDIPILLRDYARPLEELSKDPSRL
ncbi:Trm112 family protein [Thermocrinis minervae]|nr:Trm112 family protein [Thermocrinis minervae]